jgi:poly-gamma-glutamate synthesis protein (capsule biosynthesis protein)
MDHPLRARRISGSICIGIALGVFAWMLLPLPRVPVIEAFSDTRILSLAMPRGFIFARGLITPEQNDIRIVFVGDMMFDREVAARIRKAEDPAYPFSDLPAGWFDSFDFAVANLEGPVSDSRRAPAKSIDFLFDPSIIPVLKAEGIDAVSQANNHALDQGEAGFEDSVWRLREAGVFAFGHQVDDGPVSLATTTVRGRRIALLGFNTTDNALNRDQAASVIAAVREEADVVIAFVHWGTEYRDRPDASSIDTAQWLIDQGADAVIGAHPHWAQGFSSYKGKPIAWSLGNFIFDQDWSAKTRQGLTVALSIKGENIELEPIPIQIDQSRPHIVTGEDRAKRLDALAELSDEDLREQIRAGKIGF